MPLRVTAIVPRLPPAVDGVGDYALGLAQQLRQDFSLETNFVVGDPLWTGIKNLGTFSAKQVHKQSAKTLLSLLPREPSATVLLHYVGYGYARRGCPIWLVTALEHWRQAGDHRQLVTMFHEIYAFSPLWHWNSQFWTSPLQRHLATRLVMLSDRCLTSKQGYAKALSQLSRDKHVNIPALPVFSNIGEPESLFSLSERPRRLVVFGGRGSRSRVYQQSCQALEQTCRELAITEIVDVGPSLNFEIAPIAGVPVLRWGVRAAWEISQLLSDSIVGFFNYSLKFLAKSTIFAAYCAHRLIPVGVFYKGQATDGLEVDKHYWLGDFHQGIMNLQEGQVIADSAYAWYQTHSLPVQAKIFIKALDQVGLRYG